MDVDVDDVRAARDMIAAAADTVRSRMDAGLSLRRLRALGLDAWRGAVPAAHVDRRLDLEGGWGAITEMYGMLADRGHFGDGVGIADLEGDVLFVLDTVVDLARDWPAIAARNDRFLKVIVAFSDEIDFRRADRSTPSYFTRCPRFTTTSTSDSSAMWRSTSPVTAMMSA